MDEHNDVISLMMGMLKHTVFELEQAIECYTLSIGEIN